MKIEIETWVKWFNVNEEMKNYVIEVFTCARAYAYLGQSNPQFAPYQQRWFTINAILIKSNQMRARYQWIISFIIEFTSFTIFTDTEERFNCVSDIFIQQNYMSSMIKVVDHVNQKLCKISKNISHPIEWAFVCRDLL